MKYSWQWELWDEFSYLFYDATFALISREVFMKNYLSNQINIYINSQDHSRKRFPTLFG